MNALVSFFDGHTDLLLRLLKSPAPREETWLGASGRGHLDLARMKASGFAAGPFAIFVPPVSSGPPPHFEALMAKPPYALPTPPETTDDEAQQGASTMAGLLHWVCHLKNGPA
jgi:membrane dipeptidase